MSKAEQRNKQKAKATNKQAQRAVEAAEAATGLKNLQAIPVGRPDVMNVLDATLSQCLLHLVEGRSDEVLASLGLKRITEQNTREFYIEMIYDIISSEDEEEGKQLIAAILSSDHYYLESVAEWWAEKTQSRILTGVTK